MEKHTIQIDTKNCIGCGLCVKTCIANNIELKDNKAEIKQKDCLLCGQCSAICPKEAITISGYIEDMVPIKQESRLDSNTILDVIRSRRTIRQFQKKEVPTVVIEQLLEAGRLTHTAKNKQDVSFIILDREKERVERMAVSLFKKLKPFVDFFDPMAKQKKIDSHFFFFQAPLVIVILAKDKTNGLLAAQNMEFVAEANGLGTLFSGFFTSAANHSRRIKKALDIPNGKKVAMTLVLGYPSSRFLRSAQREKVDVTYR